MGLGGEGAQEPLSVQAAKYRHCAKWVPEAGIRRWGRWLI